MERSPMLTLRIADSGKSFSQSASSRAFGNGVTVQGACPFSASRTQLLNLCA